MRLELRARHRILDSRLRQLCDRYLFYALGRFEERIRRVQLWIDDVNGPRGGRDSRCVLRVGLRHGGELSVECTELRPEVAVAEVFHRARAALVRTVERRRWAPMRRHLRLADAESPDPASTGVAVACRPHARTQPDVAGARRRGGTGARRPGPGR